MEIDKLLAKPRTDSLLGWHKGIQLSLSGTNVGLVNWAAGGQNSIAVNGSISLYANLTLSHTTWDNSLDVGYGLIKQGRNGWIKSDDRIDFSSKFGRKASKKWYYAALANFKTQMTDGYNYPNDSVKISTFFAPAYVLGAAGMDFKPNKHFSMFISPLTSKLTFVGDQTLADKGSYGVEAAEYDVLGVKVRDGKRFRAEIGAYIRAQLKTKLASNISFKTKLELFSNYLHNPQNIDVYWENGLEIKLWKIITINLASQLIYDDDINITVYNNDGTVKGMGPRTQFRHMTALGLTWKIDKPPVSDD